MWLREVIGSFIFILGLVTIIFAANHDKSLWWWVAGAIILFLGLDLIIDAKIAKAKKEILSGVDNSPYPD